MRELEEELELEEADLNELDQKIAQAKAVQNSKKEKHYAGKRPEKLKAMEKIKAKITALTDRIERKARLTQNRASTPSRKRSREDTDGASSESPEKKLRTAKKFPAKSPTGTRHKLQDYFTKTGESLMFKIAEDGFEQDGGEWDEDAQRKLMFLETEVTA